MDRISRRDRLALAMAAAVAATVEAAGAGEGGKGAPVYLEAPNDPPATVRALDDPAARSPGRRVQRGPYVSVQVNTDASGQNIIGDAANEPSLAVNAVNADNIAIGWRQFDSVDSDFRQAGRAYSFDGGEKWTAPGVLTPGVFRSDPVLATTSSGKLLYQSLKETFLMDTFSSGNGGVTFGPPVPSFGGDKNWLAVDTSGGLGDGHAYGVWQVFFGCCGNDILTRSIDAGEAWQAPVDVSLNPLFGTMDVGPDGTLYVAGIDGSVTQDFGTFVVSRSSNARNPLATPTFAGRRVDMGGSMELGTGPNPAGLLGQANVFVDASEGPGRGTVYLLASVNPPGGDPLDVHVIRSADGGQTWTAPSRVNAERSGWQWLAAGDVASDGRIDVIWADTSNSGQTDVAEIFYAWSYDGGETWSGNEPITPPFDSSLGYPRQSKMGDYFQVVSGREDASAAYAATFNGEQDVYYVRLFPDCNDNGQSDVTDIDVGISIDADGDGVPDECEDVGAGGPGGLLAEPSPGVAGGNNDFVVSKANADDVLVYYIGAPAGSSSVIGCDGVALSIGNARPIGFARADDTGTATLSRTVPPGLGGRTTGLQGLNRGSCALTNEVVFTFTAP